MCMSIDKEALGIWDCFLLQNNFDTGENVAFNHDKPPP